MAEGKRPAVGTVLGVLNIIFGGLGVIGGITGTLAASGLMALIGASGVLLLILAIIGLAVAALCLVAGIGLLINKKWSVMLSTVYALANIAVQILSVILYAVFIGAETIMANILWTIIGVAYPIIVLILINQKAVKDFYLAAE